ncbi:MAG: hypothetical protein IKE75_03415 [Bacilli bacterium]|nr:hypothetical protein [Bacilli bacterium]
MDPDPYSNNSFIETNKIEPFFSFKHENSIKTFNTIFLNDETETLVFSEINFTEKYYFLNGEIKALSLRENEYMAIKKAIKNGLNIKELINYKPKYAVKTNLSVTRKKTILEYDGRQMPFHKSLIDSIVLEDLNVINKIDKINNYLIDYNRKKQIDIFREIEVEKLRKNIKVIENPKQKIKTA